MPYRVKESNNGDFIVINSETGKQVPGGNHGSDEDKAKRHVAALYANVKDAKSMAEYDTALAVKSGHIFSIGELEAALDVATTNEPINRREGNAEQADLELQHATDFRDAINLLQAGKSLSSELSSNISSSIKSYLKGGPGSGRYPKGTVNASSNSELRTPRAPSDPFKKEGGDKAKDQYYIKEVKNPAQPAFTQYKVMDRESGTLVHATYDQKEAKEVLDGVNADRSEIQKRIDAHNEHVASLGKVAERQPAFSRGKEGTTLFTKKKSFSDLKSAIESRVEELSVKGGSRDFS